MKRRIASLGVAPHRLSPTATRAERGAPVSPARPARRIRRTRHLGHGRCRLREVHPAEFLGRLPPGEVRMAAARGGGQRPRSSRSIGGVQPPGPPRVEHPAGHRGSASARPDRPGTRRAGCRADRCRAVRLRGRRRPPRFRRTGEPGLRPTRRGHLPARAGGALGPIGSVDTVRSSPARWGSGASFAPTICASPTTRPRPCSSEIAAWSGNEELSAITRRIGGWPAGAQFVLLAWRAGDSPRSVVDHTGLSTALLTGYFQQEFLRSLSDADRRFLLDSSVLDTLSGELCDAVLGSTRERRTPERAGAFRQRLRDHLRPRRRVPVPPTVLRHAARRTPQGCARSRDRAASSAPSSGSTPTANTLPSSTRRSPATDSSIRHPGSSSTSFR